MKRAHLMDIAYLFRGLIELRFGVYLFLGLCLIEFLSWGFELDRLFRVVSDVRHAAAYAIIAVTWGLASMVRKVFLAWQKDEPLEDG